MQDIIRGPIGQILTIIVVLTVYSIIAGAINGWFLQTVNAGVVGSERFDRVVVFTNTEASDEAWNGSTVSAGTDDALADNRIYKLETQTAAAETCPLETGTVAAAVPGGVKAYTPAGTEVNISVAAAAGGATVDNCKYTLSAKVLKAGGLGQVVTIVLQAAGLALPVGVLAMVGGFGGSLLRQIGGGPLMSIIAAVVIVVLAAILFNYFVPFVDAAYQSIDPNRMIIYDSGLGSLGVVVGNFWGVSLVAGMMAVGWQLVSQLRGGNMISGGGGRQMM